MIFRHCCHTPSVHVKGSVGSLPPDSPRGLVRCPSSQGLAREGGGVWTAAPVWARGGSGTLETSPERSTFICHCRREFLLLTRLPSNFMTTVRQISRETKVNMEGPSLSMVIPS